MKNADCCSKYQDLFYAVIDQEVNNDEKNDFQAHTASCPQCGIQYAQTAELHDFICENLRCDKAPDSLVNAVHATIESLV